MNITKNHKKIARGFRLLPENFPSFLECSKTIPKICVNNKFCDVCFDNNPLRSFVRLSK
jgi:hypothetical protein